MRRVGKALATLATASHTKKENLPVITVIVKWPVRIFHIIKSKKKYICFPLFIASYKFHYLELHSNPGVENQSSSTSVRFVAYLCELLSNPEILPVPQQRLHLCYIDVSFQTVFE